MLLLLLAMFQLEADDFIEKVQVASLDFNPHAHVDLVFQGYKFFDKRTWSAEFEDDGLALVTFIGEIPDDKVVKDFHDEHQYSWKLAFKAIQLEPTYGLTEDKEKLRYVIRFKFRKDRSFQVASGSLGVFGKKKEWSDRPLSDRELMKVLEGVFSNENPYVSLIKGLPFK